MTHYSIFTKIDILITHDLWDVSFQLCWAGLSKDDLKMIIFRVQKFQLHLIWSAFDKFDLLLVVKTICSDIYIFFAKAVTKFMRNPFFFQVVQNGLDALTYMADRMGHDFRPYISTIIQPSIDRLGKYRNVLFENK